MPQKEYTICTRGIWDSTVPGITFDANGVSNYARMFDKLVESYPRGEVGRKKWEQLIEKIKEAGKGKKYNCIIGVSGGTDSSYLMHLAKNEYGLKPLAVNLDNGWNSDTAVKNIKKVTNALSIDLETYVIDYEEIKDLLRAYMQASLPWIDIPTDIAIKAVLYKVASREGIKYILRGNDFRSEGTQPREWTYGDGRQLLYIHKKYGSVKLKTFPNYTIFKLIYYGYVKGIKSIYPFYYLDYSKKHVQEILKEKYGWEYYGGHHHENLFTKYAISYWLLKKFNIDKRKITYSAQILSGEISRLEALKMIGQPPYDINLMEKDKNYVLKKLDLTFDEFKTFYEKQNKSFEDYPSYFPMIKKFVKFSKPIMGLFFPHIPMVFFQLEMRD